ncbi:MAG: restriction endonuclease subunit S [Firmicutes bacterium]|jgi:type I restriction enzyme S subunit|nr:restriction endonuclease subunit S [Bacillota bacterium]
MSKKGYTTKLSTIADVIQGQSPESNFYSECDGVPFLQGNRTFGNLYPFFDTYTHKVTKMAKKGDVLMSVRAPVGALNYAPCDLCIGRGLASIKAKDGNNQFVYYALKYNVNNLIKQGSATTFDSVNKDIINDFELIIPENKIERNIIAKVLSDLDAKIELNNKIIRELEAMAKTLYDYWFVQFDFPDEEGKPYKSSGGKMVYNAELKREIPEGWVAGSFGDYCPSTGGFAFKSSWWTDKGVSVVKIKDIQEDYSIDISQLAKVDLSDKKVDDKFKAKPGDVLIAMTGATIGKYAIVPITDSPVYVNQRVGYFNLGSNPTKKLPYLINSLSQKYFREVVFSIAGGAAQPNISNEQINSIPLLIPDKSVIENYNQKFSSVYQTILNNQRQNQLLTALRDWLLPMLMNGQVRVKEAEGKLSMAAEPRVKYGKL